ncbi:MAG: aminotransferase class V-fold PLP-dependent enzyme [Gammaproteobacteria bacterium]|nr:aminotransferase class V-fold PLP-dependent enzyme [Gammaproteobacteria bacterium]
MREREFPVTVDTVYLDHAAVAPWPRRCAAAISRFADDNVRAGAACYPQWLEVEAQTRRLACQLLGVSDPDDIALVKNTSEGLSMIAHGLACRPGDNIVIPSGEFPSNRIPWQSLQPRGVELRIVDPAAGESLESALCGACDENTQLLSVSSVQYASGYRMDLETLGEFCRANHILFCVDAIQSLGACRLDALRCQADFVVADGHKWLLAPEGLAIFYSTPAARDRLELHEFGWHMTARPRDFSSPDWQISASARRFECGSPNMLGIHGLHASLSLLLEIGIERIERQVLANSGLLLQRLALMPAAEVVTDPRPGHHAGIVSFRHRQVTSDRLQQYLLQQRIRCSARAGCLRLSPHFYNSGAELETVLNLILKAEFSLAR